MIPEMEEIIKKHFGEDIVDQLFVLCRKKIAEEYITFVLFDYHGWKIFKVYKWKLLDERLNSIIREWAHKVNLKF